MGILIRSAQVRDLLGKSSLWVTGKGHVPGTGFVGLGLSVPNIVLLVVFCFPYTWISTQKPTTLSPVCQMQSSRISTYHNIKYGWASYQYVCATVVLL